MTSSYSYSTDPTISDPGNAGQSTSNSITFQLNRGGSDNEGSLAARGEGGRRPRGYGELDVDHDPEGTLYALEGLRRSPFPIHRPAPQAELPKPQRTRFVVRIRAWLKFWKGWRRKLSRFSCRTQSKASPARPEVQDTLLGRDPWRHTLPVNENMPEGRASLQVRASLEARALSEVRASPDGTGQGLIVQRARTVSAPT